MTEWYLPFVRRAGFEPTTSHLFNEHSTKTKPSEKRTLLPGPS